MIFRGFRQFRESCGIDLAVFWCRFLGGRRSPRFPCTTSVMESLFSDLLQAIISYWTVSQLESCQTSTREPFRKSSQRPQHADHFPKKASR